jgi:multidrug efflux pump subunit AcrA (membrane-fusion protein)
MGPVHSQAQEPTGSSPTTTTGSDVSLPEEMPVNESASLEEQLTNQIGIAVDRVYMNALYPERFSKNDASELERALEDADGAAQAAVRAALSEFRRARSQRAQLQRLKRAVSSPVKTLPFVFKPTLDVASLQRLAGAL